MAALGLVLSACANGLFGPFLWDDQPLIESVSRLPAGAAALVRVFTQPYFDWWGCYFRPLTTLSFVVVARRFGTDPVPQHVVNLLGHLLNVLLLYLLVRRESSSRVAALAAALWGVLPRLTESTTWVSGRTDVFAATAVFAALLLWGEGLARRCGAALFLLAGLLFKEVSVAAVPVLVLREVLRPSPSGRAGAKVLRLVPLGVVLAVYAALRHHVLIAHYFRDGLRLLPRLRLCLESLGTYVLMAVDAFRPRLFIGDKLEPRPELALLGLAAAAGLVALFLRAVRSGRRGVAEGLALAGGALAPVLHLVPLPIEARAADRFLYLPMAGIAMAIAAGSATWSSRSRRIGAGAALVLAPALAVATAGRNRIFGDEIDFWFDALRTAPRTLAAPQLYFADVLLRNGRVFEGLQLHRRLLASARAKLAASPRLAFNDSVWIGISLAREGKDDEALRVLEGLAKEDPASPVVKRSLVLLYLRRGDVAAARSAAGSLSGLVGAAEARETAALVDAVAKDPAGLWPDVRGTPEERRRQARLLGRLGGPRARTAWLDVVESPGASAETLREAATWLLGEGTLPEAARAVEQLAARDPKDPETERLRLALEERRSREQKLDAAIGELGLSGGADPP